MRWLLTLLPAILVAYASQSQTHADNWAVIVRLYVLVFLSMRWYAATPVQVCTSRFWFNYRHVGNALSMYHTVKQLGIPDSNILLMLADDMACNARNPNKSAIFYDASYAVNLYACHMHLLICFVCSLSRRLRARFEIPCCEPFCVLMPDHRMEPERPMSYMLSSCMYTMCPRCVCGQVRLRGTSGLPWRGCEPGLLPSPPHRPAA